MEQIKYPELIWTLADLKQIPGALVGESLLGNTQARIAVLGRSNVGKSSLVNGLLTDNLNSKSTGKVHGKKLAYVSQSPGKTYCIHFYTWPRINKILVDLPGYGFAKRSQEERRQWGRLIEGYLKSDQSLRALFVLLDARHGPTDVDLEAIDFLSRLRIPIYFLMTKTDLLKTQSERSVRLKEVKAALKTYGIETPVWISVISESKGISGAEKSRLQKEWSKLVDTCRNL